MARDYMGPILVSVAYVTVYYAFIINQLLVKGRIKKEHDAKGEKFDRYFSTDRFLLAADRYVLNTLEHMPTFLLLLWLNAVFVSQAVATSGGALYVGARAAYPFLIGKRLGRSIGWRVLISTVIGYVVVAYFCVRLLLVVLR